MSMYGENTLIVTGLDALQLFLRMTSPRATAAMGDAIEGTLDYVFDESQGQVPVDTGALKQSGGINPLEVDAGSIVGSITYDIVYAFYIHENLRLKHPHGGKAKYLSDPMASALNQLSSNLRGRLEAALVGAGGGAGSANHAAESSGAAYKPRKGSRKGGSMHHNSKATARSLAHREAMSREMVEEAMKKMSGREKFDLNDLNKRRSMYTSSRGHLHESYDTGSSERYHYDPAYGEERGMIRRTPHDNERRHREG